MRDRLFLLLLAVTGLLEYVPLLSPRTGIFAVFFVLFLVTSRIPRLIHPSSKPSGGWFPLIFLALASLSIVWGAMFWGVEPSTWFRGVFPFLFLLVYYLVGSNDSLFAEKLAFSILLGAWLWFALVVFDLLINPSFVADGSVARLTALVNNSSVPYPILCTPLVPIAARYKPVLPAAVLAILLFFVTLGNGYRSQTVILIFQYAALILIWKPRIQLKRVRQIILFILALSAISLGAFYFNNLGIIDSAIQRFASTSTAQDSRAAEWNFVLSHFFSSPVLGHGIGYQIPYTVTFDGANIVELMRTMSIPDSSGYLHNSTGYTLLTLGLSGTLVYSAIYLYPLRLIWPNATWNQKIHQRYALSACLSLISLFLYFQVQASFRSVQANLFICAIYLIIDNVNVRDKRLPG